MEIVSEIAKDFFEGHYYYSENPKSFISEVESELFNLGNKSDILNFLSIIKTSVEDENELHKEKCREVGVCDVEKDHLKTIYYLKNLIEENGIIEKLNDTFSEIEKRDYSEKLDKIINDLDELKKGHEIIYDGLYEEIEELKTLFFLGKKNWKQLLAGKTVEMVAGGIVSETVSKKLIDLTGIVTQNLLK
jgi:hypothetical protein